MGGVNLSLRDALGVGRRGTPTSRRGETQGRVRPWPGDGTGAGRGAGTEDLLILLVLLVVLLILLALLIVGVICIQPAKAGAGRPGPMGRVVVEGGLTGGRGGTRGRNGVGAVGIGRPSGTPRFGFGLFAGLVTLNPARQPMTDRMVGWRLSLHCATPHPTHPQACAMPCVPSNQVEPFEDVSRYYPRTHCGMHCRHLRLHPLAGNWVGTSALRASCALATAG